MLNCSVDVLLHHIDLLCGYFLAIVEKVILRFPGPINGKSQVCFSRKYSDLTQFVSNAVSVT